MNNATDTITDQVADQAADFLQAFFEYLADEEIPSEHYDAIATAFVAANHLGHLKNGTHPKNIAVIDARMWRRYFRENFDG